MLLVFLDDPLLIPRSVFFNVFYDTPLVLVLCPSLVPFEKSIDIDWISCTHNLYISRHCVNIIFYLAENKITLMDGWQYFN
jgi:hypothetical protein